MSTNLNPITPAEAFALARAAIDAHEALLPTLAEKSGPVIADTNRVIVAVLRSQVTAAEALAAMSTDPAAAFAAGYAVGTLTQMVTSATAGLAKTVTP